MSEYKDTVFLPKTTFSMRAGLPKKEPEILKFWQDIDIYSKLRSARKGRELFVLHDGPPYANGNLHIGHALNKILKDIINKYKIHYIPFGVDASFWLPKSKQECKPFVLAIGNDLARDWNTLVNSWEDNFPTLKIITSLPVNTKKNNIVVLKGSWHSQLLSDSEIRNLYRDSEFVILPLKETFQPSGQSTCLQAMGCSKAVIISNINGIWDRKLLKNKENILLVEPENIKDLNYAIKLLLKNKKLRKTLEENGRKLIQDHFNIFIMKNNLQSIFEEN